MTALETDPRMPHPAGPVHDRRSSSVASAMLRDWRVSVGAIAAASVVALAIVGPHLASNDPTAFVGRVYSDSSAALPLGTDVLGRDVWSRVLVGGWQFLLEGVIAAVLGVAAGVLLGMIMGITRHRVSRVVRFLSDSVMVIPQILLVMLVLAGFGASPFTLTVAVAIAQVTYTARVVGAAAQRVTGQDYYLAARAIGERGLRLMIREVLPNIADIVLVEFGVRLSVCFVALASLSYLGFGDPGSGAEWGSMIHENQGGVSVQPWAVLAPVAAIAIFLIGINLLRDGMSRALTARSAR